MFDASDYWITVAELSTFKKAADGLLSTEEVDGLVAYLANHPDEGVVIPDTGGLRKIRWASHGRGKRGGARVIYYFRDLNMPLYLITAFGKGEKIDLTQREKSAMRHIIDQIVAQHWSQQISPRVQRLLQPNA